MKEISSMNPLSDEDTNLLTFVIAIPLILMSLDIFAELLGKLWCLIRDVYRFCTIERLLLIAISLFLLWALLKACKKRGYSMMTFRQRCLRLVRSNKLSQAQVRNIRANKLGGTQRQWRPPDNNDDEFRRAIIIVQGRCWRRLIREGVEGRRCHNISVRRKKRCSITKNQRNPSLPPECYSSLTLYRAKQS